MLYLLCSSFFFSFFFFFLILNWLYSGHTHVYNVSCMLINLSNSKPLVDLHLTVTSNVYSAGLIASPGAVTTATHLYVPAWFLLADAMV